MFFDVFFGELLNLVFILLGVAFVTLFERKVLGYVHLRKGPNSVGFFGVLQPFSDAISLFLSESLYLIEGSYYFYFFSPLFGLIFFFYSWFVFPMFFGGLDFVYGLIYFFCLSSLMVYFLFICGWSSGSVYSMLGSVRGVAQMVSYEVSLIFVVLSCVYLSFSFDFDDISLSQDLVWYLWVLFPLMLIWLISCLAETNRSPFDFSEGESELVSGFNIEYGGVGFAFIFMSEYGFIMIMSYLSVVLFLGGLMMSFFFGGFIVFFWVWVRGSYPRFRYDMLMMMSWCVYLPVSINYLFFLFCYLLI